MHREIRGAIAILLFLSTMQPMLSKEVPAIDWTFELHTDRSINVKAVITLEKDYTFYGITGLSQELWIRNLKAYEYESEKPIENELQYDKETDTQTIKVTFSEPTPEDYRFVIEFDAADYLDEKEEKTFIFLWNFSSEKEEPNTAVVILPRDAELLEVEFKTPKKVEEKEQVTIYYEGASGPSASFKFQLTFSSSGKGYVSLAESYENAGQYDQAISYYQKAKTFYNRFNLYKRDKTKLLGELQNRIFSIQRIQADNAFQEGTDALSQKDFQKAKSQFEKAQSLYSILKDTEKESLCQEMISECERMEQLKSEAGTLLELGKTQFGNEQYEQAKESFTQARSKYDELGDTEKVSECDDWILKCEEADIGVVTCILGVLAVLLWKKYQ